MTRWWLNPAEGRSVGRAGGEALAFHRRMPGYAPTRLADIPAVADDLGVGRLRVKVEAERFGLPSFKILGASWGTYKALEACVGGFRPWTSLEDLKEQLAAHGPLAVTTATDGNHGRAVARMARLLGLDAMVFVPEGTAPVRIEAIIGEGASCEVVEGGTYDDAVARSAEEAGERRLVISDTSWPGYEEVPGWIIDGYSTIFQEVDEQLGGERPDVVVVQAGVGALTAAAARHFRKDETEGTKLIGVEPLSAACILASLTAGRIVTVPGPHDSIMAGLNCGTPSPIAWPDVARGFDAFLAVADERARESMRALAAEGIVAGETGAAGLAGLRELMLGDEMEPLQDALQVGPDSSVLLLCTEGPTDPEAYERIVGRGAE